MVDRVSISHDEALSMRSELDQMRQQASRQPQSMGISYGANGRVVMTTGNSPAAHEHSMPIGPGGVTVSMPNPKTVFYQGMEVSRETAERMGWTPDGEGPLPQDVARRIAAQNPRAQYGEPQDAPQSQQQQPQEKNESGTEGAALSAANDTLNRLYDAHGAEAATALEAAVESGDFGQAVTAGYKQGDVDAIVKGFTAWADNEMRDTGVSVKLLNELLDANSLAEARRTVINSDASKLKAIAAGAQTALADLPQRDPQGFERLIDKHFSEIAFERDERGGWLVSVEGFGMVPWASAVRMGAVRI